MGILKKNNKVLRNLSGEVLRQSDALIDIRSTYGVTKDISNNVSKIKLYNNPSLVFRAPSGNEPTENGNGLEFVKSQGDIMFMGMDSGHINQNFYTLIGWFKVTNTTGTQRILWHNSIRNGFPTFDLRKGAADSLFATISYSGTGNGNIGIISLGYDTWTHMALTVYADGVAGECRMYNNSVSEGFLSLGTNTIEQSANQGLYLGDAVGDNESSFGQHFEGSIYSLRLYPYVFTQDQITADYNKGLS